MYETDANIYRARLPRGRREALNTKIISKLNKKNRRGQKQTETV